jgi:surface antigen
VTTATAQQPATIALPRPSLRRLGLAVLVAAFLVATLGATVARADQAPQQWGPTTADLTRTIRPCPMQVSSPTAPVCWSMTEDTSAWMAQPAGSAYPWGQCTYYVGLMRPDIWNDRASPSADPLYDNWDAWTWVEHAQVEGLSVNGAPQPGDVMVYSRAAVGNDTGHVAMVDSVGGTDPSTGDLEVTVSEMNVDGIDDPSQGQGDTMTLLLPKSQLVPGMIQFIHEPAPGYTPPSWPSGSYDGSAPSPAAASAAAQDPSQSIAVSGDHLQTVSESTAPVQETVTALSTGAVAKQTTVTANQDVALNLPSGTYKVCISQSATAGWPAVSQCATGSWQVPPSVVHPRLSRPGYSGHKLTFAVQLGSQAASEGSASPTVTALVRIQAHRAGRRGQASTASVVTVYHATLHIRSGHQVLRLPVSSASLKRRHAVLHVVILAQSAPGLQINGAQVSENLR